MHILGPDSHCSHWEREREGERGKRERDGYPETLRAVAPGRNDTQKDTSWGRTHMTAIGREGEKEGERERGRRGREDGEGGREGEGGYP